MRRHYNPLVLGLGALSLILLIVVVALALNRPKTKGEDAGGEQTAERRAADPSARCASQATFDRIKLELFRQAAQIRGSGNGAFDRLATYSSVRVERPVMRERDEELGTIRCAGRLSLDLPPGVAVVGGRRTLTADIDYVLQPSADRSGDVVMLEGADPIIVPLATLARTGERGALPTVPAPVEPDTVAPASEPVPQPGVTAPAAPTPQPTRPATQAAPELAAGATARPSFNCRYARTRGEIAVCRDGSLAALDRQMASQYYRALRSADARQRSQLATSRDAFLRYRDRCANDACIAGSYRDRMREIGDIMAGNWRPNR